MSELRTAAQEGYLMIEQQCWLRCQGYDAARWRGETGDDYGLILPEDDWYRDEELGSRVVRHMTARQMLKGWQPRIPS